MAYGKKSYVKKTTKKTYIKKSPSKGPAMSQQVAKLQRQVSRLTRVAINRIQYQQNQQTDMYNALGTDSYSALPLVKFDNWSRVFGTDADDEVNKQCVIKSMKCNWRFTTNEPDARRYAIFVVSLKDNASALLQTDGTLAPLTSGTHYTASADLCLLNLNYFNIHYHKRFHSGVYPESKAAGPSSAGAVQNIPNTGIDTQRVGSWNLRFGKNGLQVKNPSGDWRAGQYPKDPSSNYFVLTFWLGDSIADGEYGAIQYQTLTQVDVSG